MERGAKVSRRLDAGETPSLAVVSAVAALEDSDPLTLTPLYEVVDPDALDTLFTSPSGHRFGEVTFTYAGYHVELCNDGEVTVTVTSE